VSRVLGTPKPSWLPSKRPKRVLEPHERGLPLGQHRAAIATIKHDLKTGRLEHARWVAGKIIEGTPDELRQLTLAMLHTVIAGIEVELDKAGL
jgi:hypothetical protein